jgi:nitrogen regulatory protein PII
MKLLTLIIRPFRAEAVLQVLGEFGLADDCTITEAKGYSRQKGYLNRYAGSEYSMAFLPKVELSLSVPEECYEHVLDRVTRAARTGRMGDGKVFVVPLAYSEPLIF